MSEKDDTPTENPESEHHDDSYVEESSGSKSSERSTEESIDGSGTKEGDEPSQENSAEAASVAVTISSLNPTVPPYTPRYSTAPPPWDNYSNQSNAPSIPLPLQIIFPPLPPASGASIHQMDLFNSAMGRLRSTQNQSAPQTLVAGLPQGFGNPYPMQPVAHLLIPQQPNYGYQSQETVYYPPEPLPQASTSAVPRPYHNPYTNLRHLDGHASCPYGHNVIIPYPALCAYCFPESQEQNYYLYEEDHTESNGSQNRKRKGSGGEGKRSGGNGKSGLGRSRRPSSQKDGTSKKSEDEAGTSKENLLEEENTEAPLESPLSEEHSDEQIPLEDQTQSTSTIVASDSPEDLADSDVIDEKGTASSEPEQFVPEVEPVVTTNVIISNTTSTEAAVSRSTSSEVVLATSSQVTCVQGSNVSCQTNLDTNDTKLMVECWTQTDSSSSTIKYASRTVSFETQDTGTCTIATATTDASTSIHKEKKSCTEATTVASSTKIPIVKVKSNPSTSKVSTENVKPAVTTSKISSGNAKPVAPTSKISSTNIKPVASTSKTSTTSAKSTSSTTSAKSTSSTTSAKSTSSTTSAKSTSSTTSSKSTTSTSKLLPVANVKPVASTSNISTAKSRPITYADIVAKKVVPKKAIAKKEESIPKTPEIKSKRPVSAQSTKKDSPLPKAAGSVPKEDKGPESRKLRMPIILELTLNRRMELSALKSSLKKYVSKGMKLLEVTNRVYLLIFHNNFDAKEVKRTNYTFGEIKNIVEACDMSQKEAELILANVL